MNPIGELDSEDFTSLVLALPVFVEWAKANRYSTEMMTRETTHLAELRVAKLCHNYIPYLQTNRKGKQN